MKNETALGHVLTLMTIIIWGTTFVSTKVLLEAFTPIEILFFRFTLGYLSLWAIYPRKGTYGTLRQELLFAAAGLCGVTLYFLLENIALTYTFASNVGVIIFDRTVLHRISGELAAGRRAAAETLFRRVRRRADGHYPHRFERQPRPQAQPRRGHPRHAGGGGLGLLLHPHEENRRVLRMNMVFCTRKVSLLRPAVHASPRCSSLTAASGSNASRPRSIR